MRFLLPLAVLALAACEPPAGTGNVTTPAPAEPASVAPATSSAEAEALTQERAEAGDLNWTGRFAATPELCTGGVWDIGERRIVTDGHTACDVDSVGRGAGQVTLRLACTAEGVKSNEIWQLSRSGADGLKVARNTGRETINVDLRRCG